MRIANWTNFKGTIKVGDRTNSKKAAHLFFFYLQLYKDIKMLRRILVGVFITRLPVSLKSS